MNDTWKVVILLFVGVFGLGSIGYSLWLVGHSYGVQETESRMKKEAIDAGVAEIGPNPNAKSFYWKKP